MSARQHAMKLQFPPDSATPNEVRRYIELTLVDKHDATPEEASEIASRWGFGRGYDFRKTDSHAFSQLFSIDVGPYLHRTVYQHQTDDWDEAFQGRCYYC